MDLPAGRLAGRDCAAKCNAKPCSRRACGGRIKKDPLNKGTETWRYGVFKVQIRYKIKKDPLNKGTETISPYLIRLSLYSYYKKRSPKQGDGNALPPVYVCLEEGR